MLELLVREERVEMVRKGGKLEHGEERTLGLTPERGQHLHDERKSEESLRRSEIRPSAAANAPPCRSFATPDGTDSERRQPASL